MKKFILLLACVGLVSSLVLGSNIFASDKEKLNEATQNMTQEEKQDYIAQELLKKMTFEEKVGQLLMVGISGTTLDENDMYLLKTAHVGGVILFDRNMDNPQQVKDLIESIQKNASGNLPVFIAIDEEGGLVARMREHLEAPPAAEKIGNAGDEKLALQWAEKTAKNIKALGFNVNFAPVADIDSDLQRSYGKDAETVTRFVKAAAQGYKNENIICSLKHFPGIGKSKVDSHVEGSEINLDLTTLEKDDLVPFSTMIKENDNRDFMVMVSHLSYPQIDEQKPASISTKIIRGILRENLGFKGIIITDDLEMGAVSKHYDFVEMGIMTIKAGSDIALVCHEPEHIKKVYQGLLKAAKNGEITEKRLDESCLRIIKVKLKHMDVP